MKRTIRFLSVLSLSTILGLGAIPVFATPVFAETDLTCTVKTHEDGSTYTECEGSGEISTEQVQQTIQQTQQAWEQETGYNYGVNIYEQTPAVHTCQDDGYSSDYYWSESAQACVTDYVAPTPVPTSTPTPVPTSTPTVVPETPTENTTPEVTPVWDYVAVTSKLLTLINNHRVELGNQPLTFMEDAVADAYQRAEETKVHAASITAYGTTTDAHKGYDSEWGIQEAQSYKSGLTGNETEEELVNLIYTGFTTGLGKNDSLFSDKYSEAAIGFADAHFYNTFTGKDKGYVVYYNILLNR